MAKSPNGNGNAVVQEETAKTRQAKASAVYVSTVDGKEEISNFPIATAHTVRFVFADENETTRDIVLAEYNADIHNCAAQMGLATRIQRSYQNEKDIPACIEQTDKTLDFLKNGVWQEMTTRGPRLTLLAQAIERTLTAGGQTVDEARRASIIEKLKDATYYEKASANPHVQAALADIKYEKLVADRKAAKEAIKGVQVELSDL